MINFLKNKLFTVHQNGKLLLQHNVAHLGIVRGQCLAECAYEFLPKWLSRTVLSTAGIAAVATALAEFIGAAIALKMLLYPSRYR